MLRHFHRYASSAAALSPAILIVLLAAAAPASDSPGFALDNGDVNGDWERDVSDAVSLLQHLYFGGLEPVPLAHCGGSPPVARNGDVNFSGDLDISDPIYLLGWLYGGGPAPTEACGLGDGAGGKASHPPRIVPPTCHAFGKTYGEWSRDWWRWVFAAPAGVNPLVDADGESCEVGQSAKVWFLAGKLCLDVVTPGACDLVTATRSCTVPAGKAIFFPIGNSEYDNVGVDPPYTVDELKDLVRQSQDSVLSGSCEIDGHAVVGLDPIVSSPYRVQAPEPFSYTLPEDNIYDLFGVDLPASTIYPAVADGVYLMVAPLSKGEHTIRFTATFAAGFALEVTYHLTVRS